MTDRIRYHVTPHPDGWQVKREHAERASALATTQEEAIDLGRKLASHHGEAQLLIHGADGRIREERTFGHDPYPPAG